MKSSSFHHFRQHIERIISVAVGMGSQDFYVQLICLIYDSVLFAQRYSILYCIKHNSTLEVLLLALFQKLHNRLDNLISFHEVLHHVNQYIWTIFVLQTNVFEPFQSLGKLNVVLFVKVACKTEHVN